MDKKNLLSFSGITAVVFSTCVKLPLKSETKIKYNFTSFHIQFTQFFSVFFASDQVNPRVICFISPCSTIFVNHGVKFLDELYSIKFV